MLQSEDDCIIPLSKLQNEGPADSLAIPLPADVKQYSPVHWIEALRVHVVPLRPTLSFSRVSMVQQLFVEKHLLALHTINSLL